jgi:RNA polymerase sigma factor for flagellar operon FliA
MTQPWIGVLDYSSRVDELCAPFVERQHLGAAGPEAITSFSNLKPLPGVPKVLQAADPGDRNALIEQYTCYVHRVVRIMINKMQLPSSQYQEFVSAGYLGLVEAAERYDPANGVSFKNFAFLRIRGAIIDDIRRASHVSGRVYKMTRALWSANELAMEALQEQAQDYGKCGESREMRLGTLIDHLARGGVAFRLSMEDVEEEVGEIEDNVAPPDLRIDKEREILQLRRMIKHLPDRERRIIYDYYFGEKTLAEIARDQGEVSKSWISRLHSKAIERLRAMLLK